MKKTVTKMHSILKYIALLLMIAVVICFFVYLSKLETSKTKEAPPIVTSKPKYLPNLVPKEMSIEEKKARFFALLVPAVKKVHNELTQQYEKIAQDIKNGTNNQEIAELKVAYKVNTDEKLLAALKPHPQSIALAQAAMESSWATSRFFVKANNVFGMWSVNKDEPRIAASEKRDGKRTTWLKKFESIEASVRAYYKLMGRGSAYEEFREVRLTTDDPHLLVEKLDNYSEIGPDYGKELSEVIEYNELKKYD